jgi:hypothetical protein
MPSSSQNRMAILKWEESIANTMSWSMSRMMAKVYPRRTSPSSLSSLASSSRRKESIVGALGSDLTSVSRYVNTLKEA